MLGTVLFRSSNNRRLLQSLRTCVLTDSFDNDTNYRFFSSKKWDTEETSQKQNVMGSLSVLGLGIGISLGIYYSKQR
ncbi:hypothetical protein LSTR_LSTR014871, partial [Laodelphax striatellus]